MENKFNICLLELCLLELRDHIQTIKMFKKNNLPMTIEHIELLEKFLDELMYLVILNIPSLK